MGDPRRVQMLDIVRYDRTYSPVEVRLGDYWNFWWLQDAPGSPFKRIQLESGINPVAFVAGPEAVRRPLIALRSSPWKAGQESTPWHDEFDLNHGHVRYFGDHKVSTLGPVGTTPGNRALLEAWNLHGSGKREDRLLAPPLILFRAVPIWRDGRRVDKGHVEFCGVGVLERLEYIVQRDPGSSRPGQAAATFPNIVVDINVIKLPGIDGRPRPDGNRSANNASGNRRCRCSAKNRNTLPAGNKCPASDSTSNTSRCGLDSPCTTQQFQPTTRQTCRHAGGLFSSLLAVYSSSVVGNTRPPLLRKDSDAAAQCSGCEIGRSLNCCSWVLS